MAEDRERVPVQYLDVSFGYGDEQNLTVWPGDELTIHPSGDIEIVSRMVTNERITMRAEHIRWFRVAEGMAFPPEKPDLAKLGYPPPEPAP